MFNYYGGKAKIIDVYPKPLYDKIIEPFAGSAQYALKYFEKDVLLVDKYETLIKIWKWLQKCSPNDILSSPKIKAGDNLNSFNWDCEEHKLLIGFIIGFSFSAPRMKATPYLNERPKAYNTRLKKIANNLFKIKHWEIIHGSYQDIPNELATWYIDPPYKVGGHIYKESSKNINFDELATWCVGRAGQVMVCEHASADWLPFVPLKAQAVLSGNYKEGIWTNYQTHFNNIQTELFK
jgi:site-specific DNA-adenine methylase